MPKLPSLLRLTICVFLSLGLAPAANAAWTPPSPVQDSAEATLEDDLQALRTAPHLADASLLSRIANRETPAALDGLIEVFNSGVSPYVQLLIVRVLPRFDGKPETGRPGAEVLADVAVSHPSGELRNAAFKGLSNAPNYGPEFLRLIVDSTADDNSRERALKAHVALGGEADRPWYKRIYQNGIGDNSTSYDPRTAKKGEPIPAKPLPLESLKPIAFGGVVKVLVESELREALRNANAAVRLQAIEELATRDIEDLQELCVDMFEQRNEARENRAWAAKRALTLVGDKFVDDVADEATRPITSGPLRDDLGALLASSKIEAIGKLTAKCFGKGKDHDKLFWLLVAKGHWDPKLERGLMSMIGDKEPAVAERAAHLAFDLGLKDAGAAMEKQFNKAETAAQRARVLPLLALFQDDPAAWRATLRGLATSDEIELKIAALHLLADFGAADLDTLATALNDPFSTPRIAAAQGLAHVAKTDRDIEIYRRVIDLLVARLPMESGRVEVEITTCLFDLTGKTFGARGTAWIGWWENEGREQFKVPTAAELRLADEAALKRRLGAQTTTSFFGIRIRSNRIIFIIDVSGSMEEPTRTRYEDVRGMPRMQRAQEELIACLTNLSQDTFFNILPFSDKVRPWQKGLTQRTEENFRDAKKFTDGLKPSGGTNLVGSLDAAFEDPEVDTIFLLSDGEPTMGWTGDPFVIRTHVQKLNANRGVTIHAVSIGSSLRILEWLATDSGGDYRSFP